MLRAFELRVLLFEARRIPNFLEQYVPIFEKPVRHGINKQTNSKPEDTQTALSIASWQKNYEFAEGLLGLGADPREVPIIHAGTCYESAIKISYRLNDSKMIELFEAHNS